MFGEFKNICHHSDTQATTGSKEYEHSYNKQVHFPITYTINQDMHKHKERYISIQNEFIHSFDKYLLSVSYILASVLNAWDIKG